MTMSSDSNLIFQNEGALCTFSQKLAVSLVAHPPGSFHHFCEADCESWSVVQLKRVRSPDYGGLL